MNTKLTVDKTHVLQFKDKSIMVSTLPEEFQNEVETMDRLRQDVVDASYVLERAQLALQFKALLLNDALVKLHTPAETAEVKVVKSDEILNNLEHEK